MKITLFGSTDFHGFLGKDILIDKIDYQHWKTVENYFEKLSSNEKKSFLDMLVSPDPDMVKLALIISGHSSVNDHDVALIKGILLAEFSKIERVLENSLVDASYVKIDSVSSFPVLKDRFCPAVFIRVYTDYSIPDSFIKIEQYIIEKKQSLQYKRVYDKSLFK